ncbi:hypothetical protein [Methylomonas koyamae]|uniref:hypothetical protein n=1 Tax=Methylomonas koyamae TaxID=702114 RepID=UPI000BDEC51B|nr:hypothetical protein [Methylomonas koyamae]
MMPATAPIEELRLRCETPTRYQSHVGHKAAVRVHILYWGVCHTDAAFARHEIIGRIEKVGADVVIFTHSPQVVINALRPDANESAHNVISQTIESTVDHFHALLDTLAEPYSLNPSRALLKRDGSLIVGRRSLNGSLHEHRDGWSPGQRYPVAEQAVVPINNLYGAAGHGYRFLIERVWLQTTSRMGKA